MEIEAKFHVRDLSILRERIHQIGGKPLTARQHEINWRFDREDRFLTQSGQVLRLRQDDRYHITYKSPGPDGIHREEIEFQVSDLQQAHAFLEALGYHSIMIYEKYREIFSLGPVEIMLDHLPFGSFIEIEGPSEESLREAAEKIGLNWDSNIPTSYLDIFFQLRDRLELPFQDATFQNFTDRAAENLQIIGYSDATQELGHHE